MVGKKASKRPVDEADDLIRLENYLVDLADDCPADLRPYSPGASLRAAAASRTLLDPDPADLTRASSCGHGVQQIRQGLKGST